MLKENSYWDVWGWKNYGKKSYSIGCIDYKENQDANDGSVICEGGWMMVLEIANPWDYNPRFDPWIRSAILILLYVYTWF